MKIVIILPTYNERENIIELIPHIQNVFKEIPHEMNILVVDDNSPDGTAEKVKQFQKEYANVYLLMGEKRGLGRAYIKGINHAITELKADAVMEMDADFSHKPEDIPRMIKELEGHDFIIGSRYVTGGKIPKEWPLIRKLNSKFGNICARYIAGIYKVKDCTAGFRAIKTDLLNKIDLNNLNVDGYCFHMTLLNLAVANKAKIKEISAEFVDRTKGESKLGLSDIMEFLCQVWMIRFRASKTFLRFAVVGLSGVFVNLGSLTLFLNLGMNKYIASPISIELSIISNFLLNNFWTFAERHNQQSIKIKGIKYNIVSFISLGISYGIFIMTSLMFPDIMPQIAQAIGIVPAMLVNYFFNSYWTFKSSFRPNFN